MQARTRSTKTQRYSPYGATPPFDAQAAASAYQQHAAAAAAAAANPLFYGMYSLEQQQQQPAAAPEELKVSQTSNPKSVAGKIAADARAGSLTPLVARGKSAVNTATKAIAIACSFLGQEGGCSLSCSPYHKNDGDNTTGRSVVFYLKKTPIAPQAVPTTTLKLKKSSAASAVAGTIAAKVRQGEVIAMQGIGPDCMAIAVDSFVVARRYLKADSKLDIAFTPHFVSVQLGDKQASAVHFTIVASPRN